MVAFAANRLSKSAEARPIRLAFNIENSAPADRLAVLEAKQVSTNGSKLGFNREGVCGDG
jgi:hypothetical protein